MGVPQGTAAPGLPVSLVAIEWCGVCGAALPSDAGLCPACKSPVAAESLPAVGARTLAAAVRSASTPLVIGCLLLDVATVLVIADALVVGGWAVGFRTDLWLFGAGAVGLVIGLAVVAACYRTWGRALGGLICGLRNVDRQSYLPAWPFLPQGPARMRPTLVDIRSGVDPSKPALPAWRGLGTIRRQPGVERAARAERPVRQTMPAGVTVIVFDSGQAHWFTDSCLLGRSPVDPSGGDVLSLPDLSRRLSASHALLVANTDPQEAPAIWLVDQGSTTGTWIERAGSMLRAPAKEPVLLWPQDRIGLGDYRFHLERTQS